MIILYLDLNALNQTELYTFKLDSLKLWIISITVRLRNDSVFTPWWIMSHLEPHLTSTQSEYCIIMTTSLALYGKAGPAPQKITISGRCFAMLMRHDFQYRLVWRVVLRNNYADK